MHHSSHLQHDVSCTHALTSRSSSAQGSNDMTRDRMVDFDRFCNGESLHSAACRGVEAESEYD